jgi:manganese/iron transport system ATP-binding protein
MLEVQNLSVNYRGHQALEGVSLDLRCGELVGLIGPNGAGKSTLIKAMLGLIEPATGRVLLNHQAIQRQRHRIAYVPQRSQIDWDYPITVWNVVMMALTSHQQWWRSPSHDAKQRVGQALERVDMLALRHRPIGALSGGQQQRVFLARALAQPADIYLFDEPFAGVDKKTENLLHQLFADLKAQNKTLLVCSHEWGQSLYRYDRLLLLNRQLLADDRPQSVMTLENLHRAYGQVGELREERELPFVC